MRPPFRPGTWRQAVITFTAVLPVSLVLNFAVAPMTDNWPRLGVVIFNAAVLVAALNWALLPALHRATRGWAVPTTTNEPTTRAPARRRETAVSESPNDASQGPAHAKGQQATYRALPSSPVAHVAAEMGIPRATASKWVSRDKQFGELGLDDRSSAPVQQSTATPGETVARMQQLWREKK